jgi:hypothetical protein
VRRPGGETRLAVPLTVHLLNAQPRVPSGNVRRFVSQAEIKASFRKGGEIAQPERGCLVTGPPAIELIYAL